MNKDPNNSTDSASRSIDSDYSFYGGAMDVGDDVYTPDWNILSNNASTEGGKTPGEGDAGKEPEPTTDSEASSPDKALDYVDDLTERGRKYNEAHREEMEKNWYAERKGYPDYSTYLAEKNKNINHNTLKKIHWYKTNPDEVGDVMFSGAPHDEKWYMEHPEEIGSLIYKRMAEERLRAQTIMAENDGLITPEAALARAKKDIEDDYRAKLEAQKTTKPEDHHEDDSTDKHEEEAKARHEAEEREKNEAQLRALKEEIEKRKKRIGEIDDALSEDDKEKGVKEKLEKQRNQRIEELDRSLQSLKGDLAEQYARNRRLFVGAKNRAEFRRLKAEYSAMLTEKLRLEAQKSFDLGNQEIAKDLEALRIQLIKEIDDKMAEFAGEDPEHPDKTPEEIKAERSRLYAEMGEKVRSEVEARTEALKGKINAEFLDSFIKEQCDLEKATIDKLDNGTLCRKIVSKVINNKYLKTGLLIAGAAGLAATGVAAATGAIALGISYTAGGIALGAGKGALSATIMSRQSSKNSAVRGFATEEEIRRRLESIDVTEQSAEVANAANWLLKQYTNANDTDRGSNRKRTAASAGLGAALGAALSGIQVGHNTTEAVEGEEIVGYQPDTYEPAKIGDVDIPKGGGAYDTFTQMGGDPSRLQEAVDIMYEIDPKYGLVPGSNGEVPGFSGAVGNLAHTYPGSIDTWPEVAQSYISEVAEEWARRGLIPYNIIQGGPIYGPTTNYVSKFMADNLLSAIIVGTTIEGTAGLTGDLIGGRPNQMERDNYIPERTPGARIVGSPERPTAVETVPETEPTTPPTEESSTKAPNGTAPEEPSAGEGSTETAPATDSGETEPAESPFDAYREQIGDEGVRLMTTDTNIDSASAAVFNNWWSNLSEAGRNTAAEIIRNPDLPVSRTMRMFIQNQIGDVLTAS